MMTTSTAPIISIGTDTSEAPMHPMTSVTLTHAHHAEARRVAEAHRHDRVRQVRTTGTAGTERSRAPRERTGLRALLRRAAELPQRLATTLRPVA